MSARHELTRETRGSTDTTKRGGLAGLVFCAALLALPAQAQDATTSSGLESNAYQLMELLNLNEALITEIATLRGQVEILLQESEKARESQKVIAADFDERISQIEEKPSVDVSDDIAKITVLEGRMLQIEETLAAMHDVITSSETTVVHTDPAGDAYEAALESYEVGDYEMAISEFREFVEAHSDNAAVPNAHYWLAESLLRQDDFYSAIEEGETLLAAYPDSDKVPDTIFLLGKAYLAMGDALSARDNWEILVADHSGTGAADKARDLLDRLP